SFSCRLDAGGFHDCTSPLTLFNLPDGSHVFQVRATDRAGKHSAIVSRAWTVKGAIDLSITAGPAPGSATNDRSPSFSFSSAAPGASFSCRMEGDPYVACSSPFTANTLPDGDHTFSVRATDADHNIAVDARDFTVDTTPPTVTVSSGPTDGAAINDTTPTFRFSATEAGSSFQCSADGGGFSACSGTRSDTSSSPLADGQHVFRVRAIDAAGNTGQPLHTGFTVDTVAPRVKIEGPHGVQVETPRASAIFTLKASEDVDRRCRSGSRRFNSCAERYRTPALSRSPHILKVKAVDRAGNVAIKRKWFTLASTGPPGTRRASHRSCHGAQATLVGTYRGDRLTGTEGRDVIVAFGGNDTVNARGGDDVICARHGADEVNGGRGSDWIRGGRGSDDLQGGPGGDTTRGGFGVDACGGAPGDRSFFCELLSLG
ncbi:MAG TPA: Ig-like domain-containing protein, partial [Solirubrobacterales bacterium]|nr:Ig-like domain-containing protein [Solirubrobacterales bacterium]